MAIFVMNTFLFFFVFTVYKVRFYFVFMDWKPIVYVCNLLSFFNPPNTQPILRRCVPRGSGYHDLTGSKKSNIAAFKPEVYISKLVEKIGTKVQRLYKYVFTRFSYPMGLTGVYCDLIPESVIQKWRP